MDDFDDPADLDGDGEFDAIDMMILEGEDNGEKKPANGKSGCCVMLFFIGGSVGTGLWGLSNYFI